MGNRRDFLKSIVPAAVVSAVPAPVMARRPPDECQFYADQLAEAMVKMHGGQALVKMDHKAAVAQVIIV